MIKFIKAIIEKFKKIKLKQVRMKHCRRIANQTGTEPYDSTWQNAMKNCMENTEFQYIGKGGKPDADESSS